MHTMPPSLSMFSRTPSNCELPQRLWTEKRINCSPHALQRTSPSQKAKDHHGDTVHLICTYDLRSKHNFCLITPFTSVALLAMTLTAASRRVLSQQLYWPMLLATAACTHEYTRQRTHLLEQAGKHPAGLILDLKLA